MYIYMEEDRVFKIVIRITDDMYYVIITSCRGFHAFVEKYGPIRCFSSPFFGCIELLSKRRTSRETRIYSI